MDLSRRALAVPMLVASLAALVLPAVHAAAQPPLLSSCPPQSRGAVDVVPRTCALADALRELDRAAGLEAAVCAQAAASAALRELCGANAGGARSCSAETRATVERWALSWSRAAQQVMTAWAGHPVNDLAVLEAEAQVRAIARAHAEACGDPVPRDTGAMRDRYLQRVTSLTATDACEAREILVGEAWSGQARPIYSPLAETVADRCRVREPALNRRQYRARALGEEIVSVWSSVEGGLVVDARAGAERRLEAAACSLVPGYASAGAAQRAAERCSVATTTEQTRMIEALTDRDVVEVQQCAVHARAAERARCVLIAEVQHGPLSPRAFAPSVGAGASSPPVLSDLSRRLVRAPEPEGPPEGLLPGDLVLSAGSSVDRARCARLNAASDGLLRRETATLGLSDARVLVASARCRRTSSDPRDRARSVQELELIAEMALRSDPYANDPASAGVTGLAGLMLTNAPGKREKGRAMTSRLAREGIPIASLAYAVSAGGPVTAEHRSVAIRIALRALQRTIEAAIDDRSYAAASAALDLHEVVSRGAALDEREHAIRRIDDAILRSLVASGRGNPGIAVAEIEQARRIARAAGLGATRGDTRILHEIHAREVELGIERVPIDGAALETDDDCARDLARRQMLYDARRADGPQARQRLIAALAGDAARGRDARGRCTRTRGYEETDVRARIQWAQLLVDCFAESPPRSHRACGVPAGRALTDIAAALRSAIDSTTAALDELGRHGDVDRSRPFAEIARDIVETAEAAAAVPWDEHGAPAAVIETLKWLSFRAHDCLSYPDVRVNLRWLTGRDVPRCELGPDVDPDPSRVTLAYIEHTGRHAQRRYGLWARQGDRLHRVDLGRAETIDRIVTELARALADPVSPYADLTREVRERLLSEPLQQIGAANARSMVVVPSAAISAIPFSVLVEPEVEVRYALSTRPLGASPLLVGRQAMVVADPVFGTPQGEIARLPGTRSEATAVCTAFRCEGRMLVGPDATEARVFAAVQERLGDFGVVHLATHGVFGGEDGVHDRAAILLSGVGDVLPETTPWDSGADGMLSESELAALGLDRTDLVVLSACGTGRGRARAGVRGLARAARVSGAKAVIGSLWSVDDRATAVLMDALYQRLRREPAPAALAGAAAAVRRRNPHPYYWAPFVLLESHEATRTPPPIGPPGP